MATRASPIDITSPNRHNSSSPASNGAAPSNLTSALRNAAAAQHDHGIPRSIGMAGMDVGSRKDSFTGMMSGPGTHWDGARPIPMGMGSMRDKPRRESVASSVMGGVSWGGISVGSWIRDDVIMTGTSPFTTQPSSFHSSSYLPKLEASFMRDFSCCGMNLPTMHDLVQHYEEVHPNTDGIPQSYRRPSATQLGPSVASPAKGGFVPPSQQQAPQQPDVNSMNFGAPVGGIQQMMRQQQGRNLGFTSSLQTVHDAPSPDPEIDMASDMDAEGEVDTPEPESSQSQQIQNMRGIPPQFMANTVTGMRAPPPVTSDILAQGRLYQHNPTVSSVNAPNLTTQPPQQTQTHLNFMPDTSLETSGVPTDFGDLTGDMSLPAMPQFIPSGYFGSQDMTQLTVDDPGKTLSSPGGGFNPAQYAQFAMATGQLGGNNDLARSLMAQQMMARGLLANEESKPYKCPVIGCEKAYKNQNGLKYHKQHGHTTQRLHENADGTFSILDPETSAPYPGTLGMEKEKPYRCEVCGKRYKNLNGLKYHKSHSPPCNPDFKLAALALPLGPGMGGFGGIAEEV